jgi:hypothetical protein
MKKAVPHVAASPDILIVAMAFPPYGNPSFAANSE